MKCDACGNNTFIVDYVPAHKGGRFSRPRPAQIRVECVLCNKADYREPGSINLKSNGEVV